MEKGSVTAVETSAVSYSCAKEHTEGLRREVTDVCWGTDTTDVCWGTNRSTISDGDGSIGRGFQRTVKHKNMQKRRDISEKRMRRQKSEGHTWTRTSYNPRLNCTLSKTLQWKGGSGNRSRPQD